MTTLDTTRTPDADDLAREARLARTRRSNERLARATEKAKDAAKAQAKADRAAARSAASAARRAARMAAEATLSETQRDEAFTCVRCLKSFATLETFRAHHVHKFLPIERCLDAQELQALDFTRTKAGLWGEAIHTQKLPSQVARLATVRGELEAYQEALLA